VATVDEAIELRKAGIDKMILILGYTPSGRYPEILQYDISQTVYTKEMALGLQKEGETQNKKARIHIKLDTGMGRIGFAPTKESLEIVKEIAALPNLEMEGLFTHFARADEKTTAAAKEPFEKYRQFSDWLKEAGIDIKIHHVANSASIIGFPEAYLDMVRSGITTYGLYPSEEVAKEKLRLKPAMQWKTVVSYVKDVQPLTSIGYGGTFTAEKPMRVATIPVGYADGMKRDLSNKGRVLLHGCYANIIGRVCMDQFMVDVTDIPGVSIGDTVTIIGVDGDKMIPVEEIAGLSHSFNYEFVCSISSRVPRKYRN
jgi:alanine racemase